MVLSKSVAATALIAVAGVAQALPPTSKYDISLTVAGSSGHQEAFRENFFAACIPGTQNIYQARKSASGSTYELYEFYAYSCFIRDANLPEDHALPEGLVGERAIVYYRSEGGAAYGYGAMAKSLPIARLVVNGDNCFAATYPNTGHCLIGTYDPATDSAAGLVNAPVDLGTSEVEPGFFALDENWPTGTVLGSKPTPAEHGKITRAVSNGTVLGVIATASSPISDLSRQDMYAILVGNYGDWIQVASRNNSVETNGAIPLCRRAPGASEQIAANAYFNRQRCSTTAIPMATTPSGPIFENPMIDNGSATQVATCVANGPSAVGVHHYTSSLPNGTKWLSINGVLPSRLAAALGDYDFWYEASYLWDSTLSLPPLAAYLLTTAQDSDYLTPQNPALALAYFPFNHIEIPVDTNKPVTLGTRWGDTCRRLKGVPMP